MINSDHADLAIRAMDLEEQRIQHQLNNTIRDIAIQLDRLTTDAGTHEARQIAIHGTEAIALTERLKTLREWRAVFTEQGLKQ